MKILIFGVTNVGKTETGKRLAKELNFAFYDLDEVIKERLEMTLEEFMHVYPFPYQRHHLKGRILSDLVRNNEANMVVAICPIFYAEFFEDLLDLEDVLAIELQDSKEHIFDRLIFSDENDIPYKDDPYKEKHKVGYLREIQEDIDDAIDLFENIKFKYFINNKPVELVVDDLLVMLEDIRQNNVETYALS